MRVHAVPETATAKLHHVQTSSCTHAAPPSMQCVWSERFSDREIRKLQVLGLSKKT